MIKEIIPPRLYHELRFHKLVVIYRVLFTIDFLIVALTLAYYFALDPTAMLVPVITTCLCASLHVYISYMLLDRLKHELQNLRRPHIGESTSEDKSSVSPSVFHHS
jgi:hypothetical protein